MTTLTTADGTTIEYADHGGEGSAVVLVHGITESSAAWDPVAERLRADHRVITMDLRGHGASGTADRYDLEAMAGDVVAVMGATGVLGSAHVVGHSLGGVVVSAVGAAVPVASVVNVDQSLQLGDFKALVGEVEPMLRDPEMFPAVIDGLFAELGGTMISAEEMDRVNAARRPDQDVVLGVWGMLFELSAEEIQAVVDGALGGYAGSTTPYLSLFGVDPGERYAEWLAGHIAASNVEVWADHGHYPHLVDPDRFVARLEEFWAD